MSSSNLNRILELGSTPILGASPTGVDATADEHYLAVMAELVRVDRIDVKDPPNWRLLVESASTVLREKSKDVEIAAALGQGLFRLHSYAGLAAGLSVLNGLVTNFWESCYPPRPRRRKARIEALAQRFTDQNWFRDQQPKADEFDAVDGCVKEAEALAASLTSRMPDEPPDLAKFIRGLKELAGRRPKLAVVPATGTSPAPTGGVVGEINDGQAAMRAIQSACSFLRKADPSDPIPYAVVRVTKWSRISLPASDAARSQIEPPEASMVDALTHQHTHGLWEHLLNGAEAAFRSVDPLWLDLQRFVCTAMARLGDKFDAPRQAVMALTGVLARRLGEGVFELHFRNGVPLCSGETRMWIASELVPRLADRAAGGTDGGTHTNGKLSEASSKARTLAGAGKLKEALQVFQDGLGGCTQRRDRLLWRLGIAQLCFDTQCLQLAGPLLEDCYEEIRRYHIDEWEPSLAVSVVQTLYRCRKSLTLREKAPPPQALDGVRESFAWLCQLDPLAALVTEPVGP